MQEKFIIGTGRHAAETWYLLEDIGLTADIVSFVVDNPEPGQQFFGKKVMALRDLAATYAGSLPKPAGLIAIGAVDVNKRIASTLKAAGFPFFSAIHPTVRVDRQRSIGQGVTIAAGSVLTCNITIGDHAIINIGCTISHDCVVGNHVNISPGCHLAGHVHIEDDVFVGTGASFIPRVRIGKGSIIAAGACVTKDIPPYSMAAGVPAVVKKQLP